VSGRLEILALRHESEIAAGCDLAQLVLAPAPPLRDGDVVVIAHKAVAKSEGRVVELATVDPSPAALELSSEGGDPRMAELVLRESRRIVRRRGGLLIAETHHGFVCASAGIDRSNGPAAGWAVLLPVDPDASAAALRAELERRSGARVAVVVADTMGRALRRGIRRRRRRAGRCGRPRTGQARAGAGRAHPRVRRHGRWVRTGAGARRG
jgi:coenzyme F420-0:L-glutamate ligase / coenzyme F420-1:gamma-L-glutamate ligase